MIDIHSWSALGRTRAGALLFMILGLLACRTGPPVRDHIEPRSSPGGDRQRPVGEERPPKLEAPVLSNLGDHHRKITTDRAWAERMFDQGLVLHYGFNHAEAVRSFRAATRLDPQCASCFAGVALSLGPNINAGMDPENAEPAYEASHKALELARERELSGAERGLIEAIAKRYAHPAPDDRKQLDEDYAEALKRIAAAHPNDADVAALYAESLMIQHAWDYWESDGEPKEWTPPMREVLERLLERYPKHPFANHLYIHLMEASRTPEAAMPSARLLEDLVPGAGHLVHMPAHIYIRTGEYHKASQANERAIEADQAYLAEVEAQGAYPLAYYPHNYHFLWATATLEGRAERALEAARGVAERADRNMMKKPGFATLQHYYAIPHYARVAFGRWRTILDTPAPEEDLLYPRTVWHYARGMAFASRGSLEEAGRELDAVREAAADDRLQEVTIWDINTTDDLVEIAAEILAARMNLVRGNHDAAINHLRKAVRLEDGLNYDEPPPWGPATRRYLGAALLAAGRPEAAEQAYRQDLENFPDNGWALYGLLESLRTQGKTAEADRVQSRFEEAWQHADVVLTSSAF